MGLPSWLWNPPYKQESSSSNSNRVHKYASSFSRFRSNLASNTELSQSGWWCNNHLEKYEFANGKDDIPYMTWKIKFMFETTNRNKYIESSPILERPPPSRSASGHPCGPSSSWQLPLSLLSSHIRLQPRNISSAPWHGMKNNTSALDSIFQTILLDHRGSSCILCMGMIIHAISKRYIFDQPQVCWLVVLTGKYSMGSTWN